MRTKVDPKSKWSGPVREYDIIKEGFIALLVIGVLAAGLSFLFSSPDEPAVTLDRKSTRLNSSHVSESRMPSSA